MIKRFQTLRLHACLGSALLMLLPALAAADGSGWIEFGFGHVSDDSFRFGRYNGLHREGGYGVLAIDWFERAAPDADDSSYRRFTLEDLGLDSRRGRIEHGRQGDYRLWLDFAQLPALRNAMARTLFTGVGGTQLTLPANWVSAGETSGMSRLLPSLRSVPLRQERRRIGAGFDKQLASRWQISTRVRHESKQGIKAVAGLIGNTGGNPRAVFLPEPIDYETREAEVSLRYSDPRKQLEFRYLVSLFDDGNSALSWQNPYSAINGWDRSAGYPSGFGQLSLPPDNQFHQVSAAAGYSWDNGLRWSGELALGRMTQDAPFLPYTINPQLAASITQPLPRASLDGRIDTTVANLRLSGRAGGDFYWNASLRYDDRDNRTPRDEYVYIGGDSNRQNVASDSFQRRFNEPRSYSQTRLKLDGSYRIAKRTRLSGSLEQRDTERTYSEREQVDETLATLKLRHTLSDTLSGMLRVSRADRDGSTYHGNEPFLSAYSPGYTNTVDGGWENSPRLRRFHLADRVRDQFAASLSLAPSAQWNFGLDVQRIDDDYRRSELGLTRSDSTVYTLDIGFVPSRYWSAYFFYARENMALDQDGVSIRGFNRVPDEANPDRLWRALHRDHVDTAGLGFKWNAIEDRLELGADYIHAQTESDVFVTTGPTLDSAPLPPNRTRLNSISLYANYRLRSHLDLRLRVWNERFDSSDIAYDNVAVNQLDRVILLGADSADYRVNVLSVSLVYRF